MTGTWARDRARGAALDRLAAGRTLDATWVADLETDTITCITQGRGDILIALEALHAGLHDATNPPRPRHARTVP